MSVHKGRIFFSQRELPDIFREGYEEKYESKVKTKNVELQQGSADSGNGREGPSGKAHSRSLQNEKSHQKAQQKTQNPPKKRCYKPTASETSPQQKRRCSASTSRTAITSHHELNESDRKILRAIQRGEASQYQREAVKDPLAERAWKKKLESLPRKRQRIKNLSKDQKARCVEHIKAHPDRGDTVQLDVYAKRINVEPYQLNNQYKRVAMENKKNGIVEEKKKDGRKRRAMPRIEPDAKLEIEDRILDETLGGSVDRDRIRRTLQSEVRKEQMDRICLGLGC